MDAEVYWQPAGETAEGKPVHACVWVKTACGPKTFLRFWVETGAVDWGWRLSEWAVPLTPEGSSGG
jgi:hypothetical protein